MGQGHREKRKFESKKKREIRGERENERAA
jgi:hypothetical protein